MTQTRELDYSRHYLNWHNDSDAYFARMTKIAEGELKDYLPKARDADILEIGAGMGFAQGALRDLGFTKARGIDSDRSQVTASQKRGLNVMLVPVAETLSYLGAHQAAFDLIFAIDVLEHVPVAEQIAFLEAARSALKPGAGLFMCRVPNASSPLASHYRYVDWTHTCAFTKTSLDFVLYSAGFRDIEIVEATPNKLFPSVPLWIVRSLVRRAHRLALASDTGWKEAKRLPMSANIVASAR